MHRWVHPQFSVRSTNSTRSHGRTRTLPTPRHLSALCTTDSLHCCRLLRDSRQTHLGLRWSRVFKGSTVTGFSYLVQPDQLSGGPETSLNDLVISACLSISLSTSTYPHSINNVLSYKKILYSGGVMYWLYIL